jgi:hypothetical protein
MFKRCNTWSETSRYASSMLARSHMPENLQRAVMSHRKKVQEEPFCGPSLITGQDKLFLDRIYDDNDSIKPLFS